MKNLKSLSESKKIKYGTLNLVLIAIVVAVVIMLNSIFTVLTDTFNWRLDMTEEQLYSVSDELVTLLDSITQKENAAIDIIFCCDRDEAEGNFIDPATGTGSALAYIHSTATQIEDRLNNVTVMYKDTVNDHDFIKQFNSGIDATESSVIVARKDKNGNYGTMYRVYHATSFYTFAKDSTGATELYGYSGERTFASAIISLTYNEAPTAYFVTGHSETVPYSTASGDFNVPSIATLFLDCGFRVRYIYLDDEEKQFTCKEKNCGETWGKKEIGKSKTFDCECGKTYHTYEVEFNEDRVIPDDARAIIINNPKSDYTTNELDKLSSYLLDQKGTIMCFTDPVGAETSKLQNLYKFIKNETGVTIKDASYVTHGGTSTQGQINDFKGIVADNNAASVYLGALQEFGAKQPTLKNSGILEIDKKYLRDEPFSDVLADRVTMPLIETPADAVFDGRENTYAVMSVTALTTMYKNEQVQSYFVVCPSAEFVSDTYLSNTMYANSDVMLGLVHSTTAANVPVDLDFKEFANYQLDISSSQATTVFICLVTIMPLIAVAVGIVVIVRRKRR